MFGGPNLFSVLPHTVRPGLHIPLRVEKEIGKKDLGGTARLVRVNRTREKDGYKNENKMGSEKKGKIGSSGSGEARG